MNSARLHLGLAALAVLVVLPGGSLAQLPGPTPTPFPLTLEAHERVAFGKVAAVEGNAGADLQKFSLAELQITQPVLVALVPIGRQDELELQLYKGRWDAPVRTERATGAPALVQFRTQGDLGIGVRGTSAAAAQYQLLVWAGEELDEVALAPAIVPLATAGPAAWLSRLGLGSLATPLGFALVVLALAVLIVLASLAAWLVLRAARLPSGGRHA